MTAREVSLDELRTLLVENTLLRIEPQNISADQPLFGDHSLGLDSIDALQLAVAVERRYQVSLKDPKLARSVLGTLGQLQAWLNRQAAA
jgi:acyl carrier protein